MALRVPIPPRVMEVDQLLSWEAELSGRWAQLQARRRDAEKQREKQIQLEASLRELDNENIAAELVLEERRRTLSTRRTQLEEDEATQVQQTAVLATNAEKRKRAVEEETRSIDAGWRELERATQQDDAAHTDEVRSLQWTKQRSLQREAKTRARLDALREREAHLLAHFDALRHRKQRSTELIRQTLAQLQRELDARQAAFSNDGEAAE